MTITEKIKSFLTTGTNGKELSSEVDLRQIKISSEDEYYPFAGGFFDGSTGGIYQTTDKATIMERQKLKIMGYRILARQADVSDAIEEICNEVIFSTDDVIPIQVTVNEENEKIKEAITSAFNKIYNLMNLDRNFFNIVRSSYVDGQMVAHLMYEKNSTKNGIQKIELIEPVYLFKDIETNTYKYLKRQEGGFLSQDMYTVSDTEFSPEEIVREDFSLYNEGVIEGYLDVAIKPANQLRTLEDLLVPMRFSRSVSRRVFNVDIGDISPKRGEEVLAQFQNKFKYKKFYNVETGEVTNQQHVTSLVEDYWFANRSGGKGTTVDTIDETGNLGELGDILYFYKKLYKAMKIPSNRIPYQTEGDNTFDFSSTSVTKDDLKFFMFISKIRKVYSAFFKKILKMELLSTQVLKESEWNEYQHKIKIIFTNENKFISKMKLDAWTTKLDIYTTAKDYAGNVFSYKRIMQDIFELSEEEVVENLKEIAKEKKNPLFKDFYATEEE